MNHPARAGKSPTHLRPAFLKILACTAAWCTLPAPSPADDLTRTLAGADVLGSVLTDRAAVKVQFEGATTFREPQLREAIAVQLQEISEHGLSPARGDDAAFYLGSFYRKQGFAKVEVNYEIRGGALTLRVAEGPRTLLRRLTFTGNRSFPEATLYDYMIGATPERFQKEPAQFPFSTRDIEVGADRVRGFYISQGWLDVAVDAAAVEFTDGGTRAGVTVKITEGSLYVFGDIQFEGGAPFDRGQLLAALGEKYDGPFSGPRAINMQRNLQSFFKAHGYFQAVVTIDADPAKVHGGGKVPVLFHVKPDGLFHFGDTRATNPGGRLRGDFLPKRFAHLRGQVYDPAKVDETYREMLRTGLFKTLRVNAVAKPGHLVDLELTVEETLAKEVGFTLGYGTYDGATVGLRLADRDLLGRGRPLTFAADWSQRGLRGELLYVDPWLFDTRFALRARIFSESRDELGYSKNSIGARGDLARTLFPHFELATFVEAQAARISNITIPDTDVGPTSYDLTSIGFTTSYDRRDNATNPGRGFIFNSSLDLTFIDSQAAFTRATVRFSYYLPVGQRCQLALGARAGLISPIGGASIPVDVRFFNGGGNTVRSFAERELGPRDSDGNPLGGEFYTVLNAEFTFPLISSLQGAVFIDAGNLTTQSNASFDDMRYAVGLGLRYKLPVGPLRLDYGLNPDPKPGEDRGAFHFSFGFAF